MPDPILSTAPLGFPWPCQDPFLFCVYHLDEFPAGNELLGPAVSTAGRNLGHDFDNIDGWNMYHGHEVPGFPQHPHRGFETVTYVRRGLVDHSDSLGAAARYGQGDAQWLTTGAGISHSEMFPLLDRDKGNPAELFQIWLNLPAAKKMSSPRFSILWSESIPQLTFGAAGAQTKVSLVAGTLEGKRPPAPPPDSWASQPGANVAIWGIRMDAGTKWTLPAGPEATGRTLYYFKGAGLRAGVTALTDYQALQLRPGMALELEAGSEVCELLLLQGRPLAEPVAQYGPFVMNTKKELEQAFEDYRRTQFGGWPWQGDAPVHARSEGRFARHADGHLEKP